MKQLAICLFGCLLASGIKAQVMAEKPVWITIKSGNLKCWQCKDRLEKYLISENESTMQSGMLQRRYNLINGELRVQYLPDRVSVDVIRTVINNAGFDADEEKADSTMYKKLPPECKRAEEGGGPQKGRPCHVPPY